MAVETQRKCSALVGRDWSVQVTDCGSYVSLTSDRIAIVLQWEILQELRRLNTLLSCQNFVNIPRDLRSIKRELAALRKIATARP